MSNKGDDVKTLFAHLGLNPDDYRELHQPDEADSAAGHDTDNWPHVDPTPQRSEPPKRQEPKPAVAPEPAVPPRVQADDEKSDAREAVDQAAEYDPVDDVLDDALVEQRTLRPDADEPPEVDVPEVREPERDTHTPDPVVEEPPHRRSPRFAAEPAMPEVAAEAGPERWSLLANFDDLAGNPPEAEIEGLDTPEQTAADTHAAVDDDRVDQPTVKRRLFGGQDDADTRSHDVPADEQPPSADEFWDEVVPQGHGDVDIDALIEQAEPAETQRPAPEKPSAASPPAREAEPRRAPEPAAERPRPTARPVDADSALGGMMARLRAGPGPRQQTKARISLTLDAPARETVADDAPADADLKSVLQRLKATRRG